MLSKATSTFTRYNQKKLRQRKHAVSFLQVITHTRRNEYEECNREKQSWNQRIKMLSFEMISVVLSFGRLCVKAHKFYKTPSTPYLQYPLPVQDGGKSQRKQIKIGANRKYAPTRLAPLDKYCRVPKELHAFSVYISSPFRPSIKSEQQTEVDSPNKARSLCLPDSNQNSPTSVYSPLADLTLQTLLSRSTAAECEETCRRT